MSKSKPRAVLALEDLTLPSGPVKAGTVIVGPPSRLPALSKKVRAASEAEVEMARPMHVLDLTPPEAAALAKPKTSRPPAKPKAAVKPSAEPPAEPAPQD